MDELDALWAFLVAALIAFAVTPPTARLATPARGAATIRASATCTSGPCRGSAAWRSWPRPWWPG